jgi:hypothetical protein
MEAITVYKCSYCKKLFRTPNKHKCKMDPVLKNCFSCGHLKCFDEDRQDARYGDAGYRYVNPVCGHSEHYEHDTEDIIDVMYHNKPRWSLNCPEWKQK